MAAKLNCSEVEFIRPVPSIALHLGIGGTTLSAAIVGWSASVNEDTGVLSLSYKTAEGRRITERFSIHSAVFRYRVTSERVSEE